MCVFVCVYEKVNAIKHGSSVDIFVHLYTNIIGVTEITYTHFISLHSDGLNV